MRSRHLVLLAAVVLAAVASACRVSLATDIEVERDGSGVFAFAIAVDEELQTMLDEAGVDLTLGLDDAVDGADGWELRDQDDDEGRTLTFTTPFASPAELTRLVEELHEGLSDEDPAVLRNVSLQVDDEGAVSFAADAGLRLPATTGATGDGVTFDDEDLRALIEREGARVARYDLRLVLPGDPVRHDADAREGRALTWTLPIGDLRAITAESRAPTDRTWLLVGATFLVSAAAAALVVVVSRRRGSRLAGARAERPGRG